jgi:hypothetical protein
MSPVNSSSYVSADRAVCRDARVSEAHPVPVEQRVVAFRLVFTIIAATAATATAAAVTAAALAAACGAPQHPLRPTRRVRAPARVGGGEGVC